MKKLLAILAVALMTGCAQGSIQALTLTQAEGDAMCSRTGSATKAEFITRLGQPGATTTLGDGATELMWTGVSNGPGAGFGGGRWVEVRASFTKEGILDLCSVAANSY
jgi:hypothetical protein